MRKLIIILLIAVIACAEVDNTPKEKVSDFNELLELLDLDANSVELQVTYWFNNFSDKVKRFFGKLWDRVKDGVQWLKEKGIWDKLVSFAKTGSKYAVSKLCAQYFDTSICKPVEDVIFKFIDEL